MYRKRLQFDKNGVKEFSKNFLKTFKEHAVTNAFKTLGTPMLVKATNMAGAFPTRYWQQGTYEHWEKINADAFSEAVRRQAQRLRQVLHGMWPA